MQKKNKQKDISQIEKPWRGKRQCPAKLAELIELVNLVPPNVNLPNSLEIFDAEEKTYSPEDSEEQRSEKILNFYWKIFQECFQHFSKEAKRDWVLTCFTRYCTMHPQIDPVKCVAPTLFYVIAIKYEDMRKTRKNLRGIVDYFTHFRKLRPFLTDESDFSENIENIMKLPLITSSIQITGTIIEVVPSDLGEAINKVDGDRIRACVICNRIFWAKRKDSETCSTLCFNNLRQRRHRQRNKEEINVKRRENYHYKKGGKKNGTL